MHVFGDIASAIILVVAALFPIVNPPGSAPIFLSLTSGYPHDVRKNLILRVSINSFLLLVISIWIGSHVLRFFGVSIPVVQIAGGLIVSVTGWNLLAQRDVDMKKERVDPAIATQQAFYPLTLPVTVGPGSISVAIALGANMARNVSDWPKLIGALIGSLVVAVTVYISFRSGERLERVLGQVGMGVFLRLSAFIVICIGVQITWNGVAALIHSL